MGYCSIWRHIDTMRLTGKKQIAILGERKHIVSNFLSDLYYRVKYNIIIHRNVLKEEERLILLEESKKHLKQLGDNFPGLQTYPDLHQRIQYEGYLIFHKLLKKIMFKSVVKCWSNYSDSEFSDNGWHTHPVKITSIYYMENPEGLGTLFRHKGKEFRIDVPTNTLMIIPGNMEHNAPSNVNKPRQCIVIDTNE